MVASLAPSVLESEGSKGALIYAEYKDLWIVLNKKIICRQ